RGGLKPLLRDKKSEIRIFCLHPFLMEANLDRLSQRYSVLYAAFLVPGVFLKHQSLCGLLPEVSCIAPFPL
ncbi:MAG: hypothetical protein OXM55_01960, partial [Bdellovibrionales bacterium]|nr:hypothetical protein [Bdellovibrionales bacterium]